MLSKVTALALLFSAASAHMKMTTPAPYGSSSLNNSPLNNEVDGTAGGGSDYPCKQRGADTYTLPETGYASMALGSIQELAFMGSAVHGGGSCQVSISYDLEPTASSTFKVIHSIEGGCPMKNIAGNNGDDASLPSPDTYNFTIPTDLPTGKATLAWTWFNKVGNREMYMNCAPIEISGGSGSTTKRDTSAYDSLPDIFVANIPTTTCSTPDSTNLLFPNPGTSVDKFNTDEVSSFSAPVGDCGASSGGSGSGSGGSGSGSGSSSSAGTAPTSAVSSSTASAPQIATSSKTVPGGVFATVAPTTTLATSSIVATSSAVVAPPATTSSASTAPGTGSGSGSGSSSGTAQTAGSACSPDGQWNCIDGKSYQQCASGVWSVVQALADGTSCTAGTAMNIAIVATREEEAVVEIKEKKRSLRFPFARYMPRNIV